MPKFLLFLTFFIALPSLANEVPVVRFNVNEFVITGDNPLSDIQTQTILSSFVGEHEGLEGLLEAAAELESYILLAGYSFHRVILPAQTMESGSIQLRVITFTLGGISVTGNDNFSDENIIASLPGLKLAQVPDTRKLSQQLSIANEHPAKAVTIRMKQGKQKDSIDAELAVSDKRPWQVFTSISNIGTDETGEFRLSAGYQNANLLNLDDTLTISYTTSPGHWGDVKQYGFNYRLPLYFLSGSLSFFYSRSDVDSGTIEQVFDVSGAGKFWGSSYTHTFLNLSNYRHRASVEVQDKLFENDISFQGNPLGIDVRSRPLQLSYSGEWRFETTTFSHQFSYIRNLPGGSKNTGAVYAAARFGAKQTWEAIRFRAAVAYSLPRGWQVNGIVNGQYTDEALISGEQFGGGGINSVRGFEERAVTGDKGLRFSLELWTPPLKYNARFLGFIDSAYLKTINAPVGQIDSETLLSIGLGLRWRWTDRLSINLDYGHEVNEARAPNAGGVKTHLSVFYRF